MLEDKRTDELNQSLSRRNFLLKTGTLTAGMAAAGVVLGSVFGNEAEAAVTVPLPYKQIDTTKVMKKGFDEYWNGGCMYGAAKALVDVIKESVGSDTAWDKIPVDVFKYGSAGIGGWGTLCGALNGALFVMTLAAGASNVSAAKGIGHELMNWYCKFQFPSNMLDNYIANHSTHKTTHNFPGQFNTIADSPLCHVSVSKWCVAADKTVNSVEKKARCAKLTGITAARAADYLNKLLISKRFHSAAAATKEAQFCLDCHNNDLKTAYEWDQGKMYCEECHDPKDNHDHTAYGDNCIECHK